MKLFIDASGWVQLMNPAAPFHEQLVEQFSSSLNNNDKIFTHNIAVGIALSDIRRMVGAPIAKKFSTTIEEAYTGTYLSILWIGRRTQKEAIRLMRQHMDLDLDVYDFASYVLMQRRRINSVMTTRADYRSLGLRVIPEREE